MKFRLPLVVYDLNHLTKANQKQYKEGYDYGWHHFNVQVKRRDKRIDRLIADGELSLAYEIYTNSFYVERSYCLGRLLGMLDWIRQNPEQIR